MDRPDIKRLPKRMNPMEAQNQLLECMRQIQLNTETVHLADALGRVLAKDVSSEVDVPDYDKTFIDGYAICAQGTKDATVNAPAAFKVVGKLFPADYPTSLKVGVNEAVYVACGAPIPRGATATVKVEETRLNGDSVEVVRPIETGKGVIPRGDDVKAGDLVARKGRVLRPQDVGLLASVGLAGVEVFRKPVVAVLSGGDELIKQFLRNPQRIANNYSLVVADLASELGASPLALGIMPDAYDKVQAKISEALGQADIVVTIGGTSVGVKDFVPDAVNELGKPGVVVQGVLVRPGAVSGFGFVDGKPVVMLPGHIGSCIAGFYLFAAPLILHLSGVQCTGLPHLTVELNGEVDSGPQFRFQLLRLTREAGRFLASPVEGGSSALTTMVKSNGYALIPPHITLAKGSKVEMTLFNKLELSTVNF